MMDKTWRQESKEFDRTQDEALTFHRRFTAGGSSTVASEGQNHPHVTVKREKRIKSTNKERNVRKTDPAILEGTIRDSGYNHSESKESVNLSNYNLSKNSEVTVLWREQKAKKRGESKELKTKKIKNIKKLQIL